MLVTKAGSGADDGGDGDGDSCGSVAAVGTRAFVFC